MAEDGVHVQLSAEDDGLVSELQTMESRLQSLEDAFKRAGVAGHDIGEHFRQSGEHAKNATSEYGRFGEVLDGIGSHGRTIAMGLDAIGLSSEASAARVGALADAFKGLKDAVPELLLIAAAGAAVFGAFDFLKDATAKAGEFDQQLNILGATIRAQGGNWNEASEAIKEYAELQERTTIYSKTEVLSALRQLTSAGMDYENALKVNRIAEDAAAATGRSLEEVDHSLVEAMHGRTQALVALGIGTKQSIHDGMQFNDVLAAIEKQMGGTAEAAANTLPGAMTQLKNTWESFLEDAGQPFQQMLIDLVHDMTDVVRTVESEMMPAIEGFARSVASQIPNIEAFFGELWKTIQFTGHVVREDVEPAFNDLVAALAPVGSALSDLTGSVSDGKDGWERLRQAIEDAGKEVGAFFEWIADHKAEVEVFFDVIIGVNAIKAVRGLRDALLELTIINAVRDGWSAFQLVLEAFELGMTQGIIPAIRNVIVALYDLAGAEAVATLGISVLIGAVAAGALYLATHWSQTVGNMQAEWRELTAEVQNGASYVLTAWADLERAGAAVYGWFLTLVTGSDQLKNALYQQADAADAAADALRRKAQANRDANAQAPSDDGVPGDTSKEAPGDPHHHGGGIIRVHPKSPANPANANTGIHAQVGGKLGHSQKTPFSFTPAQLKEVDALAEAHARLKQHLADSALAEERYGDAVKLAITPEQKLAAEIAQRNKIVADANAIHQTLNDNVAAETRAVATLEPEVKKATTAYNTAASAYDSYGNKLKAIQEPSKQQLAHLKQLHDHMESAKVSLEGLTKKYDEEKKFLDEDTNALRRNNQERQAAAIWHAAQLESFNANTEAHQRNLADEEATYGKSIQQQLAYFQQRYLQLNDANDADYSQRKAYEDKILGLEGDIYKQRVDHAKKMYDDELKYTSQFLDDVIVKHKSFKDSLKSIYDEILKSFIDMIAKMIVQSQLFKSVFGNLGGGTGGGFSVGGTGGGSANSLMSLFAAGSQGGSAMANFQSAASQLPAYVGGPSVAATPDGSAQVVKLSGMHAEVASALSGAMVGGTIATLTGGNAGMGSLFGGMGGLAALALHANPLIGFGIEAVSGLLGGMIGPHWGPASNTPDRNPNATFDGMAYGQFGADWQGSNNFGANGQNYNAESQYNVAQGNLGLDKLMENWANAHKDDKNLSQSQQAMLKQILGLENGNANADLGIANLHNGIWTLASGAQISVSDASTLASTFQNTAGKDALQPPVFQITRTYPDYNQARDANGNVFPGWDINHHVKPPDGGIGNNLSDISGQRKSAPDVAITVNIEKAVGLSETDLAQQLAPEISKELRRINDQYTFGGYSLNRKQGGDFRN